MMMLMIINNLVRWITMSRSSLFKLAVTMMVLSIMVVVCWSFGAYLITPFYRKGIDEHFVEVPGLSSLKEESPTLLEFEDIQKDAFMGKNLVHKVWVIKHSSKKMTVFSPICPHLGCLYDWENKIKKFVCPCHGSVFSCAGKVLEGPAPRPLDTLPWKIEDGKLYVKWEEFKPGIPKKVEIAVSDHLICPFNIVK